MRHVARSILALALAACTYDWRVGPVDAGPASQGDATAMSEASDDASGADVSGECQGRLTGIGIARSMILACKMTCYQSVQDECGCEVPVEDPLSTSVQSYVMDVAAFKAAGCKNSSCSSMCGCPAHICFRGFCG